NVLDGSDFDGKEVFIIGGEELFKEFMPYVDKIYATVINEYFKGDTFFPPIEKKDWDVTSYQKGKKDDKNNYDYYFIEYERKKERRGISGGRCNLFLESCIKLSKGN